MNNVHQLLGLSINDKLVIFPLTMLLHRLTSLILSAVVVVG